MKKNKVLILNNNRIIFLFFSIILVLILLRDLEHFSTITIVGDEFGYWATAAKMAGYDWSSLASRTPYYSYGYGILLAPLFFLFKNPEMIYKMAIVLNAIMVWGIFYISIRLVKKLDTNSSDFLAILIGFSASTFCAIFLYAYCAWSEIASCFFVMLLVYLMLCMLKKPSYIVSCLLSATAMYLYQIHQRNLGFLLATVIVIVISFLGKKIKVGHLMIFFVGIFTIFILHYFLKQWFMDTLYLADVNSVASINDYSGQVSKLKTICSVQGIVKLFDSVIGKIYYLGVSTFFIAYFAIYVMVKHIIQQLKTVQMKTKFYLDNVSYFYIFILFAGMATVGIASISMLNPARVDTVIYGRYTDSLIVPLLVIGLTNIRGMARDNKWSKMLFLLGAIFIGIWTYNIVISYGETEFYYNCAPGASYFWLNGYRPYVFLLVEMFFSIFIIGIIFFLLEKKKSIYVITILLINVNIFLGVTLQEDYLARQKEYSTNYKTVSCIRDLSECGNVYIYGYEDTNNYFWIESAILQFMLYDMPLKIINESDLMELKEKDVLLVSDSYKYTYFLPENFELLMENRGYNVYKKR